MRRLTKLALCTVALLGCDRPDRVLTTAPLAQKSAPVTGFLTAQPAQAYAMVPSADVTPIITVGDQLSNGYVFAPTPDGLGAYQDGGDLVVFANHELSAGGVASTTGPQFRYARVSRLVLDPATLAVQDATYVLDGSDQYQRLCSATWVGPAEGFPSGYFFTGEEATGGTHDGIQLAIGRNGQRHELPWIGRFAHENLIAVPGFPGRVVVAGFDDTAGNSELYIYVGATEADVINGTGKLYVFGSDELPRSGDLVEGQTIAGHFVEVANPGALSSSQLQAAVNGLGAFKFVRLEDGDYDHRTGRSSTAPAMYFVDTGSESVRCGAASCDPYGSIYRMTFGAGDPTSGAQLTLLQRSRGAGLDWASPDNIASGKNSLMVMEDPAYGGFARAPRIWNLKTDASGGFVDRGTAVVELTNPNCVDALGTCWESSGIIDASSWLGAGAWLFDVQAHTLPVPSLGLTAEGGQLLVLRLPGS